MISGKDVRIENGYIIINGEKYPIVQDVSEIDGRVDALEEIVRYNASDVSEVSQSITLNEINIIKNGKVVTIGINFTATGNIALYTNLLKLPGNIKSYGGSAAIGFVTDKTHLGALWVNTSGYVVASSNIPAGSYYQGQLVFIMA